MSRQTYDRHWNDARLSALAIDLKGHVAELDINPLFVLAEGRGVIAADALIKPKK